MRESKAAQGHNTSRGQGREQMSYRALDRITASDIAALGIPYEFADQLHLKISDIVRSHGLGGPTTWTHIYKTVLSPDLPFPFHQMMYYGCYCDFGPDPPAWVPCSESTILTNVGQLLERCGKDFLGLKYKDPISSFSDFQDFSISAPEAYWKILLDEMGISFSVPPNCILLEHPSEEGLLSNPGGQWLPGAFVNPAENCLSLNKKRALEDVMILWRDEGNDDSPINRMTLLELRSEV